MNTKIQNIINKIKREWYSFTGQLGKLYLFNNYGTTNTEKLLDMFKKQTHEPFTYIGDEFGDGY